MNRVRYVRASVRHVRIDNVPTYAIYEPMCAMYGRAIQKNTYASYGMYSMYGPPVRHVRIDTTQMHAMYGPRVRYVRIKFIAVEFTAVRYVRITLVAESLWLLPSNADGLRYRSYPKPNIS